MFYIPSNIFYIPSNTIHIVLLFDIASNMFYIPSNTFDIPRNTIHMFYIYLLQQCDLTKERINARRGPERIFKDVTFARAHVTETYLSHGTHWRDRHL